MKRVIYADNAATTKLDAEAFEAMKPFLTDDYANASQVYSFARHTKKALQRAREMIAECINANPEEIYFTSGGSESNNWALKGIVTQKKHSIITSRIEHHSILNAATRIKLEGGKIKFLPVDSTGVVKVDELDGLISKDTSLISVMYANNEIGSIQPIQKLTNIAHQHNVLFHTDAVQAIGHVGIDVKQLGVDLLSASAHKFNGPKGIGFLYIKRGTDINPIIDGGAQEFGMRAGTENIAAIVGMAVALKKNCEEMANFEEGMAIIEKEFIQRLRLSPVQFLRNGSAKHIPGNVSLSFLGADGEMLLHRLDLKGICVSTGSACNSKSVQISHVLEAIGLSPKYAKGTIRISFGKNNKPEEAVAIADAIISILEDV